MRVSTPAQQHETAQAMNILNKSDECYRISAPGYIATRSKNLTDVIPFVMLHHFWGKIVD